MSLRSYQEQTARDDYYSSLTPEQLAAEERKRLAPTKQRRTESR